MIYRHVTQNYRVSIPKKICDKLHIKSGQKLIIYEKDGIICLTSQNHDAKLLTLDNDFRGLSDCEILNK